MSGVVFSYVLWPVSLVAMMLWPLVRFFEFVSGVVISHVLWPVSLVPMFWLVPLAQDNPRLNTCLHKAETDECQEEEKSQR